MITEKEIIDFIETEYWKSNLQSNSDIFKTVRIAGDDYSAFVFPSPIKVNNVSETKIDDEFTKVTLDGVEYQAITCAFYGYIAQKEISFLFNT